MSVADIPPVVRALVDKEEIRTVLATYCRAIDRLDAELLRSIYQPDATEDHITFKGSAVDFVDWALKELADDVFMLHLVGSPIIELNGDRARSETYWITSTARPTGDGKERFMLSGGRYLDRFERRDGGRWLIAQRIVTREWASEQLLPAGPDGSGPEGWAQGLIARGPRNRDDLAYRS